MHPEAAYWALLSGYPPEDEAAIIAVLGAWHARGKRSVNELFERDSAFLTETLGIDESALAPLLRLRPGLTQAHRLVERLARDDVELVTVWERRYPRQLKQLLGDAAPMALWHAGPLKLLDADPVAVLGSREAPVEALDFAHHLGAGLARAGRPVATGMSRAVERAALETALRIDSGTAVVILGQGIARIMPELRHWQSALRGGRLLVVSLRHPEAAWQPWLESLRGLVTIGLAAKIVVAHVCAGEDVRDTALQALRFEHSVFIRAGVDTELERQGAIALPDGKQAAATVVGVQPLLGITGANGHESPENAVPASIADERDGYSPDRVRLAEDKGRQTVESEPDRSREDEEAYRPAPDTDGIQAPDFQLLAPPSTSQARNAGQARVKADIVAETRAALPPDDARPLEVVLRTLMIRVGRKTIGKGTLLLALGVEEAHLDTALATLIGSGEIVQRSVRGIIGYTLADADHIRPAGGTFQPSLFGTEC